jgi:hypothetical protein
VWASAQRGTSASTRLLVCEDVGCVHDVPKVEGEGPVCTLWVCVSTSRSRRSALQQHSSTCDGDCC